MGAQSMVLPMEFGPVQHNTVMLSFRAMEAVGDISLKYVVLVWS